MANKKLKFLQKKEYFLNLKTIFQDQEVCCISVVQIVVVVLRAIAVVLAGKVFMP